MVSKVLSWVFRGCGIAPSGTRSDKYFTVLCMVALSLISFTSLLCSPDNPEGFKRIWYLVAVSLNRLAIAFIVLYNNVCPESYISIGRDFVAIDKQLHDMGISEYQLMMTEVTVVFLMPCGSIMVLGFSMRGGVIYCISAVTTNALINGPCWQEIIFAVLIHSRLLAINDHLVHIAANPHMVDGNQLDSVFRAHFSLQALLLDVDRHYCFYNMFHFTARFMFSMLFMYDFFMVISQGQTFYMYDHLIVFAVQTTCFVCLVLVCYACSQEANRTVLLAYRVLQPITPFGLCEKVGLFSTLATGNKLQFTIGGLFTLNRALVTNTVLTSLAYLIIAIQLKDITVFQDAALNVTSTPAVTISV